MDIDQFAHSHTRLVRVAAENRVLAGHEQVVTLMAAPAA